MSISLFVPPSNQPVNRYTKTSSYTIPAGRWARVKPLAPKLTIDGVQQYSSIQLSASRAGNSAGTTSVAADFSGTVYVEGTVQNFDTGSGPASGSGSYGIGSNDGNSSSNNASAQSISTSSVSTNNFTGSVLCAGKIYAQVTIPSSGNFGSSIVSTLTIWNGHLTEFYVLAGTVLDGAKYIVEEYLEIT